MQTLRKKTSPLKFKNETTKFLGDGVSFKAKLIGILEVSEARGDRMCQEALCDLKMAIRAAGEHKQRITVNIAIDGLRLRDEKTGDCLYHHPVHKISFIAQDMTDSRAFGYIFGSPDTGHRFFGIKTDKAASQVVIAMRDLFQVVFALKKKEIELAKQHLEKSYLPTSPLFSDSPSAVTKVRRRKSRQSEKIKTEQKNTASSSENKNSGTAVADLVDLELELSSLQQGLNQMERITPSDPFGSKDDPFGDSFISYPVNKLILPPPPSSGRERAARTSECSTIDTKTPPNTAASLDSASDSLFSSKTNKEFSFSRDYNSSHEDPSSGDWFTPSFSNNMLDETQSVAEPSKDDKHQQTKQEIMAQFDVFTELDPLGTGKSKPYIDKKHFFQELKNPPKKALNELVSTTGNANQDLFNINFNKTATVFSADPFGDDPFVTEDPFADSDFSKQDPFETEFAHKELHAALQNNLSRSPKAPHSPTYMSASLSFDVQFDKLNVKNDEVNDNAPQPPPRPINTLGDIEPPPLPPKKQMDIVSKPPPRPPHTEEGGRYDYIKNFERDLHPVDIKRHDKSPALPVPHRKSKFESDFANPPERPRKYNKDSSDEDYLAPITFPRSDSPAVILPPPQRHAKKEPVLVESLLPSTTSISTDNLSNSLEGLDMTLSQLTLSGLNELATKLKIPPHKLSNMTLVQLTNYLSSFIKNQSSEDDNKFPAFQADFASNFGNAANTAEPSFDRYAVFRELQEEIKQTKIDTEPEEIQEEKLAYLPEAKDEATDDKYAALREIVEIEIKTDIINDDANTKIDKEAVSQYDKEHESHNKECEGDVQEVKLRTPDKSPARSPILKSPIPSAITEVIQSNTRLTSGSLSDVLSGSSPEVDNTGSNSDGNKKNIDPAGESWAIFDQTTAPSEAKDNLVTAQSEEGVSPWSSDSKEFGNRSPTDWKKDPKMAGRRRKSREQEDWWDTSADPEGPYPSNRRSTDSYEDEYYECYDRPRRRRQANWQHGNKQTGGHSSSSRDVSPWEEEPRRRGWGKQQPRGHSFDRHRDKHVDSWDEEEDYEYDDEHRKRVHHFQRHGSKDSERHSSGSREMESDRWDDYGAERRYRRRREGSKEPKDRWCCPDADHGMDKSGRYIPRRGPDRRERYDERYRSSRESQDSPWEDEYSNEPDSPHYVAAKKNWKRPSSASEMDRKTGEIKSRHFMGAGNSDGERDRRYKGTRRSRSRDSQFSEPGHRHKPEPVPARTRNAHKDYVDIVKKPAEVDAAKKPPSNRKKPLKEGPVLKSDLVNTFPRKGTSRTKSLFDNDFVPSDESPIIKEPGSKFTFENDFDKVERESKIVNRSIKGLRQQSMIDKPQHRVEKSLKDKRSESFQESKISPRYQKPRSPFEDDFSPSDKTDSIPEGNGISCIKEEPDVPEEDDDSYNVNKSIIERRKSLKNRLSTGRTDVNLKKSGSVNIFARENDPFDDDFFSGANVVELVQPRNTELRWSEEFEDSDNGEK